MFIQEKSQEKKVKRLKIMSQETPVSFYHNFFDQNR